MAGLRAQEESRKLMSPNSDLSFEELESNHYKPASTRSSNSDFSFSMHSSKNSWRFCNFKTLNTRQLRLFVSITVALVVAVFVYLLWTPARGRPIPWNAPNVQVNNKPINDGVALSEAPGEEAPSEPKWVKPTGFKIVGFVFYGRPRYVNVLDCYLRKNLVSNGGYLDEVIFMVNTKYEEDREWLDELIKTEPLYKKKNTAEMGGHFDNIWNRHAQDENTMYIKIDDDVVFIHDDAIPRMVHTLMDHPEAHDVAANIVNSPLTHWLHYHTEAILPYLPDMSNLNGTNPDITSWRASELPRYEGKPENPWDFTKKPEKGPFQVGMVGGPPSKNHRWLPMEPTSENLMLTPVAAGKDYNPWGKGWTEWTMAAQQHYSLLEHMEKGDFGKYWGGNQDGIWNMQYTRYNLNFLAIWGKSVKMMNVNQDDEDALTVTIPKALKRPCLIDTHAIVGHFSFGTTPELETTDLLERHRLYANEKVCTEDNKKSRLDPKFYEYHKSFFV